MDSTPTACGTYWDTVDSHNLYKFCDIDYASDNGSCKPTEC
jgi:hypothetical protein